MKRLRFLVLALLALGLLLVAFLQPIRRAAVAMLSDDYVVEAAPTETATFDALDEGRARFDVVLTEVASGFDQPTELAFAPDGLLLVVERKGTVRWVDLASGDRGELLNVEVRTTSEQGLLGIALHPQFAGNGRFFLNYVERQGLGDVTVVEEWSVPAGSDLRSATASPGARILEVAQPYQNHNAGQLLFGRDGKLYVPLGDGGLKDDIHGHAQDRSTLLGSILRLDVDLPAPHVPSDNPFVGEDGVRPEIWAYGVRNPWRSAFHPDGRLIVADVGQDTWEEVGFARRGASLGWNDHEARHCFPAGTECEADDSISPFWEYPHPQGLSITGGVVYGGAALPRLAGRYLAGDFVTGRLWAVPVPSRGDGPVADADVFALGKWDLLPSTFVSEPSGEVLVADYGRGRLLRLGPSGG